MADLFGQVAVENHGEDGGRQQGVVVVGEIVEGVSFLLQRCVREHLQRGRRALLARQVLGNCSGSRHLLAIGSPARL
jgi:hypothetical protein